MSYTFDSSIVSDLHKDARGYRPDAYFWEEWTQAPDCIKQQIWDRLISEYDLTMQEHRAAVSAAVASFENQVAECMSLGAGTRENAIRWIINGLALTEHDLSYGAGYICYHMGLPYTMEDEIADVLDEMKLDIR